MATTNTRQVIAISGHCSEIEKMLSPGCCGGLLSLEGPPSLTEITQWCESPNHPKFVFKVW